MKFLKYILVRVGKDSINVCSRAFMHQTNLNEIKRMKNNRK